MSEGVSAMVDAGIGPAVDDIPFNEPARVELAPNEQATVTFRPVQANSTFYVPIIAASKEQDSTYRVRMDSQDVYGPAAIPPTDIDDLGETFVPPRSFVDAMEIVVTNLSTATRTYDVQPVGWEVRNAD